MNSFKTFLVVHMDLCSISSILLLRGCHFQCLLLLLSHFSHIQVCATPQTAAIRLPHPWDSPGKNTGVGCNLLPQCMKVKSESEVAQSCPILSDPMDYSPPGSSIHGILQARALEWGAIAFSECLNILSIDYLFVHQ